MKILITGASGMLALEVIRKYVEQGHAVIQTDINPRTSEICRLDVTHLNDVIRKISEIKPDFVFHLAAETNVDLCEEQPDHAYAVNTLGTANVVMGCKKTGSKLVYISTGAVFGGDNETGERVSPYTEIDKPIPVTIYGKSKLQGEEYVRSLLEEFFIVRAGWMVGGWEIDKKFVYKIVKQLKDGKKELNVVNDKSGSPTFTADFADNLVQLVDTGKYGVYHMANKGECTRFDLAVKIVEYMGLADKVKVHPVSSDMFPLSAKRARSEVLTNDMLEKLSLNNMPLWQNSLEGYIKANKGK